MYMRQKRGFTLVEEIIVIAIIGILAMIILVSLFGVRGKARDTRRKTEISQIGRFLMSSCYSPEMEEGEYGYDLVLLADELINKYPQYSEQLSKVPKDPKTGTESESKYYYIVSPDGKKCGLYANLENPEEPVTLSITEPTPGGGIGVFRASSPGWNGTPLYFQYSN